MPLRSAPPPKGSSSSRNNLDRWTASATRPCSYPPALRPAHPQSTSLRQESNPTSSWCWRLLGVRRGVFGGLCTDQRSVSCCNQPVPDPLRTGECCVYQSLGQCCATYPVFAARGPHPQGQPSTGPPALQRALCQDLNAPSLQARLLSYFL